MARPPKRNRAAAAFDRAFDRAAKAMSRKGRRSAKKSRRMKPTRAGIFLTRKLILAKNFTHDNSAVLQDTPKGFSFKLSDCSGVNDMVSMYDQYCIKSIGYRFVLRSVFYASTGISDQQDPNVCIAHRVDLDDDTQPTSLSNLMECDNVVVDWLSPVGTTATRWYNFSPRVASAVFTAGSAFSGYAVGKKGTWINNTSTGVDHYGLKAWVVQQSLVGTRWEIDLELRYTIGLKHVI